jgi:hypothetical protein
VTDPEPAVVPVNTTKQVPAERVQVLELSEPPVVPTVKVNVTVPPVGVFAGVVVSLTTATTFTEQLVPPSAMLQLTLATLVAVLSRAVLVTVIDAEALTGLAL